MAQKFLDFGECLKDSPKFRADLEDRENALVALEHQLEKFVKVSEQVVESGKAYNSSVGLLVNNLDNLATYFYKDVFVSNAVKRINKVVGELQTYLSVFLDQTHKSLKISLNHFIKEDIKKVKDTKKLFDKISDDLDSTYVKNSQLLKNCRQADAEEAENILIATKSCFHHIALDYTFYIEGVSCLLLYFLKCSTNPDTIKALSCVTTTRFKLNSLQSKQRFQILSQIVMFMNGSHSFHTQSNEALSDFEDYQRNLSIQLEELQVDFMSDQKEMEERHTLVREKNLQYENILNQSLPRTKNIVIMDGYLFKRASNAFKTWNRRWFVIQNNKLYYTKRSKSDEATEMVDLRLSTVKNAVDLDRRFTFSVVCPTKCWYLQADNEQQKERWIKVMQMAIARALNDPESSGDEIGTESSLEKLHPQFLLSQIRDLPGNDVCADCSSLNPKWASINIGIVVCIGCSGIHRSLGVHISKVRSITLDDWDMESIKLMIELGNEVVNDVYEAEISPEFTKPLPDSDRATKESYIKAKYVQKRFISRMNNTSVKKKRNSPSSNTSRTSRQNTTEGQFMDQQNQQEKRISVTSFDSFHSDDDHEANSLHPNLLLYKATKSKNLSMMILAFVNGANVNWRNQDNDEKTPLHESVIAGSVSASEYLLQNGAEINLQDTLGRSALHYASLNGSTGHTCLFLKRDADQKMVDNENKDPLAIALQNTHADIVTLLRLARLHEEIKETDITMGGDETVTDVFRDFSNMASHHPERLAHDRQTYI